jgi:hypothetical protein
VYKTSIAAVLLVVGIDLLLQAGTNAMVVSKAGPRPDLAMPSIVETVALRRGGAVTRHVAGGHRGVTVRPGMSRADIEGSSSEPVTSQADMEASPPELGTSRFDIEASQPVGPMSQWAGASLCR